MYDLRLFARGLSRVRAICNVPRLQVERELSRFAVTCLECALVSNTLYGNEGKVKTPYLVSAVSACNGTTALVIDTMSPQLHGGDFVDWTGGN